MKLKEYLKTLNKVYHITFNPLGIGVARVHLVPPKKITMNISWVIIINGVDILPITSGWAILLKEFIETANELNKTEITETNTKQIINDTVEKVLKIFPKTKKKILSSDLKDILYTINDIANGKTPELTIGYMKLAEYAKYMIAPHRMDLMISSMMKNNMWNCNQKCLHCYANTEPMAIVEELSTEQWKKIIDKLQDACVPQITFTGGEPTLRDDLVELVEYSKYFVTRLNTNGIKLTDSLCKALYDASLDSVQVTLYSDKKELHNMLVGTDRFDETINGIKNAIKNNLNVSINTPLCYINKNYLDTIKFAAKLGVKYFSCSGIIMTGNATSDNSMKTYLSKAELLEILKEVCSYCKKNLLEISFTSPGWLDEKDIYDLDLVVPSCGAALSNMAVAPNGDVIPCQSYLNDNSLGNLLDSSLKRIYKSKKCKAIRKKSIKNNNVCQLAIKEVK